MGLENFFDGVDTDIDGVAWKVTHGECRMGELVLDILLKFCLVYLLCSKTIFSRG